MRSRENWIRRSIRYGLIGASLVLIYVLVLINTGVNTIAMHTFGKMLIIGSLMFVAFSRIYDETKQVNIKQVLSTAFLTGIVMAFTLMMIEMLLQQISGMILAPDFIAEASVDHIYLYPVFAIELMLYSFLGSFISFQYYKNPVANQHKKVKEDTAW